ncbi:hypothetical protein V8E36_002655 [Tilletia maclaganii]
MTAATQAVPPRPRIGIALLGPAESPLPPAHFLPSLSSSSSSTDAPRWLAMGSIPAHATLASFQHVMNELVLHPERSSTTILRADILDTDEGAGLHTSEADGNWTRERSILRRMMPRRPNIDWPLLQSCDFWTRSVQSVDSNQEETEACIVYTPLAGHISDGSEGPSRARLRPCEEAEVPFYHPKVRAIAFRFIPSRISEAGAGPYGTIRIDVCPFDHLPSDSRTTHPFPPSHRLSRTVLVLLQTIHAHTWGSAHNYAKRVHHDVLVPRELYQDTYLALKGLHAERIIGGTSGDHDGEGRLWVEKTDPEKHVFEDIGIAAWLMCLWKEMYPASTVPADVPGPDGDDADAERRRRPWTGWARPPGGFVDVGCGNGLLVHLLHLEGYKGFGVDLRERKSWVIWRADALAQEPSKPLDLREASLDLPALVLGGDSDFFPAGSFLVGNHADEISPWMPLLTAAVMSVSLSDNHTGATTTIGSAFASIACCPFMLDGSRYGSQFFKSGGEEEVRQLLSGSREGADDAESRSTSRTTIDALVTSTTEALQLGPPVDRASIKAGSSSGGSRNLAYLQYLSHLQLQAGWMIEKEALRIPSTKNWALVGRRRVWEDRSDVRDGGEALRTEVQERIGRLAEAARPAWKARGG